MGLFSVDTWDYTKLKETIDTLTGSIVRRRAQHVILFDLATGQPITLNSSDSPTAIPPAQLTTIADKLAEIFPSGISNFDLPAQTPLTSTARPLTSTQVLCRSTQIQSIKPDGTPNTGLIAIGTSVRQEFYLNPGDVWGDSAPLGQMLDLSQIYARALTSGDCITLVVRV